jgi:hypothetical protein
MTGLSVLVRMVAAIGGGYAVATSPAALAAVALPAAKLMPRSEAIVLASMLAFLVYLALLRDGSSFGSLVWATMLSVEAVAVVCTLTWRAHWLRPVVRTLQGIA